MKIFGNKNRGFTLIELMIVIAIVGILASVAYPAYTDSVRKARRVDAMNNLLKYQIEQEKYRASNVAYAADFVTLMGAGSDPLTSSEGYYTLAIENTGATTFRIVVTGINDQANDSDCANYAVDQNGPITGDASYASASCWNQ